jgi:PAS domain S-box-containing protein
MTEIPVPEREEQRRPERDFAAAIFDAAASPMVVLNRDGIVLRINRACEQVSGYSRAEVIGRSLWEFVGLHDPAEAARLKEEFERHQEAPILATYEDTWVRPDGERRLLSWSVSGLAGPAGELEYIITSGTDITEARRWQEALAESEERYRSLFAYSMDAVLLTDPDGRIYAANPEACRIFGRSEEEICQLGRAGLVDSNDPRLPGLLEERARTGKARGELTYWRADGTTFAGEVTSTIFLDRAGRQKTSMIIRDITARKQAEEALRLSEERFRSAFENAAIGMALVAPDGRWLRVNRAFCRLVGYSEEELLRSDFQSITHPDDLEMDLSRSRQLLAGEIDTFQLEKRYLHKQGQAVWVVLSVSLMRDSRGQPLYFITEVQDITARLRAEEVQRLLVEAGAALSSSIDYATTLGNVARLIVRSLADYCLIDLVEEDGQVCRVAGAHRDPACQGLVDELLRYNPRPNTENAVAQVIRTRQPMLLADITDELITAGASDQRHAQVVRALSPNSCLIVPLESRAGVIGAMSLMIVDHGRRYSDGDLSLATELARRAALALENAGLYQQARDALASRDALLSIVSHDIRNDLISIMAFATMLPDFIPQDGSAGSAQLREGLGQIKAAAEQMNHLVQDPLDFARLQDGRPLKLDRPSTDLVALARQVAVEQQRTTANHQVVVAADQAALVGLWDRARLARVLVNLLSNAIKYSPGGGEVRVAVSRQQDRAGAWAVLAVQDHGVGIPADDLPHIFTRFTRARNVEAIKGLGLGLFSVQQIVEQHGGTVTVASAEGAGSVFTVRLPLPAPDRPPAGAPRSKGTKKAKQ